MLFSAISVAIIASAWFRQPRPPQKSRRPPVGRCSAIAGADRGAPSSVERVSLAPAVTEAGIQPDAGAAAPKPRPHQAEQDPLGGRM